MREKNFTAKPSHALSVPVALVIFVFFSHGMLLLNDGVYWDGWTLYGFYLNRDTESLLETFRLAGAPWSGYFHLAFWIFPNFVLAYKLTAFLSILLAILMVYILGLRSRIFTARESVFVALIFCAYTGYQVHVELITLPYSFYFALFLLGIYLIHRSLDANGNNAIVLRGASLILLFLSFQVASLLVFYFPFLLWIMVEKWRRTSEKGAKTLFLTLLGFIDFLVLPFVFWNIRSIFWTPYGVYAGYNSVLIEPARWAGHFETFFDNAVFSQFLSALELILANPILALSLVISCLALAHFLVLKDVRYKSVESTAFLPPTVQSLATTVLVILIALLLFLCASFPYAAVDKFPATSGWDTRHALLIGLPVAVGLIGVGRLLSILIPARFSAGISVFMAGLLVSGFALLTINIYLEWQARWVKDLSVITNLKKLPPHIIEQVFVIKVEDEYRIGSEPYRFYEYAGMFKAAWQQETRVGFAPGQEIDSEKLIRQFPLKLYLLKDFRAGGCQITLRIQKRLSDQNNLELVKTYFQYKWFNRDQLNVFLESVTNVQTLNKVCNEVPISSAH